MAERACKACRKRNFLGSALVQFGVLLVNLELDLERAESYLKRAIPEIEKSFSDKAPERERELGDIFHALGTLYLAADRYDEAASFLLRALSSREATRGRAHEKTEDTLVKLDCLLVRKRAKEKKLDAALHALYCQARCL
eukprot:tig00021522_g22105.t1